MNFCVVRLGKDSVAEINQIDSYASLYGFVDFSITLSCKQVPNEIVADSLAFIWLGSDNNKGVPTKWEQGLRAFGRITAKSGGPGYNDDWLISIRINYIFKKSIKAADIIEQSGADYLKISAVPVLGINTHSNQTIQTIKFQEQNQDVRALFYLLNSIDANFIGTVTGFLESLAEFLNASQLSYRNTANDTLVAVNNANSDVESEDTSAGNGPLMQSPFDPKLIDIKQKNLSIDLLIKRLKAPDPEIDLFPSFQRGDNLWDSKKQSQLIESILISFPLPAFYFDGTNDSKWLVVDGLQRLSALRNFIISKTLRLVGLEFLHQLADKTFDELPRTLQRQIEEAQIVAYIINPGTPIEVKYNIFKRINTGGLVLEPQEIRHALNQGYPANIVSLLAASQEFKMATDFTIKDERMLDREFITRFVAFYIKPYTDYKPDLDSYMNLRMADLKHLTHAERDVLKNDFLASMKTAKNIFQDWTFRKVFDVSERRKPINKALFEVWSVSLAKLAGKDREKLQANRQYLFDEFISIMRTDNKFISAITSTTGDKTRVTYRFTVVADLIKKALQYDNQNSNKEF